MLNLQERTRILQNLKNYLTSNDPQWLSIQNRAAGQNAWFIPEFIQAAVRNIADAFLEEEKLMAWIQEYKVAEHPKTIYNVGIVMAGNIPLVGFHDFLCVFVSGHRQTIKLSSKDDILLKHLVDKMTEWEPAIAEHVAFADMLKGCDAYIATGSNNTARYFEYYFKKYPHIIRKNRTSVAIVTGTESKADLEKLADDVYLYFGMGCRNVTKLFVPADYNFELLLNAFRKYDALIENHKYKHNYDFNLAMHIVNQKFYMTNESVLLSENTSPFSRIGQLHYEFYTNTEEIYERLMPEEIQCIAGVERMPFGSTQFPSVADYADGIDTMLFLQQLDSNK